MHIRSQGADNHIEEMAADQDYDQNDITDNAPGSQLANRIDNHADNNGSKPQGKQTRIREHIAQILGHVVKAQKAAEKFQNHTALRTALG